MRYLPSREPGTCMLWFNYSISRVSYVHSSRASFRKPKHFRSLSICANADSLPLSLYLSICRCIVYFDYPEKMCMHKSPPPSLSLSLRLQKRFGSISVPNGIEERMWLLWLNDLIFQIQYTAQLNFITLSNLLK